MDQRWLTLFHLTVAAKLCQIENFNLRLDQPDELNLTISMTVHQKVVEPTMFAIENFQSECLSGAQYGDFTDFSERPNNSQFELKSLNGAKFGYRSRFFMPAEKVTG